MKNHLQIKGKKLFKTLGLSMVFSGMIFSSAMAQFDVQIGTGTGTNVNVPIVAYYGYSYSQQIYTVGDLNSVGITGSAEISKIRFLYTGGGNFASSNQWVVYLGNTAVNTFASNTAWIPLAELTPCLTSMITSPTANVWMELTLTTPFIWDGTSNLVVAVEENEANYASADANFQVSNLGANRSIYYRSDSNNPNPATPPTATGRLGSVPNIQLVGTPTSACSGLPLVADISSSGGLSLCENGETNLSISNLPFESGYSYQWQLFDGSIWNDIVDETANMHSTGSLLASNEYRVVIGCSNSGLSTPSNSALITVNPNPTVEVDIVSAAICPAGSETITASGATSYIWSPATGLSATNIATVTANPANSTTYTVTGTDANGCIGTATSLITPVEQVSSSIQVSPIDLCETGIPVLVSVDALPAISGGTWSYRFLEVDGITEAQTWSTSNEFNFIPNEDSLYTFYYQVQNSACGEPLDSVAFDFAVGFGADITTVDYDCNNMGGTIELSNVFGQNIETLIYSNDFNLGSDMSDVTLTGSAANNNGMIEVTQSATGQSGYCNINGSGVPIFNNSFTVSFNMTIDQPIVAFGFNGADGMTYSFGDNATPAGNGNSINGRGNKLRLCFDSAPNGTENFNEPGIYLVYGWNGNIAFGPGNSEVLAYSTNTALWHNQISVPVVLNVSSNGRATVIVGGVTLFSDIQLPPSYISEDVSNWKHLFSAGTGGSANRHAIDNFDVTSRSSKFALTQGSVTDEPTTWQNSSTFTDVQPGVYHVWMSKDETNTCLKLIETVEIISTDPVIELGMDTTICEGEILTLDAGYPGSTYLWSNSTETTQTIDVDEAGSYAVYLTAANGCSAIGSITVDVQDAPSATGISVQGNYPNVVFTVNNATATDNYDWDFGDGTTSTNAPATIFHSYSSSTNFEYDVTATLTNDCGSVDVSENFVLGFLSIDENAISGLTVYPNPATDVVTIAIDNSTEASLVVYSMTGSIIDQIDSFNTQVKLNVSNWENGVYFIQITNEGKSITQKVVVQ